MRVSACESTFSFAQTDIRNKLNNYRDYPGKTPYFQSVFGVALLHKTYVIIVI